MVDETNSQNSTAQNPPEDQPEPRHIAQTSLPDKITSLLAKSDQLDAAAALHLQAQSQLMERFVSFLSTSQTSYQIRNGQPATTKPETGDDDTLGLRTPIPEPLTATQNMEIGPEELAVLGPLRAAVYRDDDHNNDNHNIDRNQGVASERAAVPIGRQTNSANHKTLASAPIQGDKTQLSAAAAPHGSQAAAHIQGQRKRRMSQKPQPLHLTPPALVHLPPQHRMQQPASMSPPVPNRGQPPSQAHGTGTGGSTASAGIQRQPEQPATMPGPVRTSPNQQPRFAPNPSARPMPVQEPFPGAGGLQVQQGRQVQPVQHRNSLFFRAEQAQQTQQAKQLQYAREEAQRVQQDQKSLQEGAQQAEQFRQLERIGAERAQQAQRDQKKKQADQPQQTQQVQVPKFQSVQQYLQSQQFQQIPQVRQVQQVQQIEQIRQAQQVHQVQHIQNVNQVQQVQQPSQHGTNPPTPPHEAKQPGLGGLASNQTPDSTGMNRLHSVSDIDLGESGLSPKTKHQELSVSGNNQQMPSRESPRPGSASQVQNISRAMNQPSSSPPAAPHGSPLHGSKRRRLSAQTSARQSPSTESFQWVSGPLESRGLHSPRPGSASSGQDPILVPAHQPPQSAENFAAELLRLRRENQDLSRELTQTKASYAGSQGQHRYRQKQKDAEIEKLKEANTRLELEKVQMQKQGLGWLQEKGKMESRITELEGLVKQPGTGAQLERGRWEKEIGELKRELEEKGKMKERIEELEREVRQEREKARERECAQEDFEWGEALLG